MPTRTDARGRAARLNPWTPIAAVSIAGLALVLALGCVVHESSGPPPPPPPAGGAVGCGNQPNMKAALDGLRDARGWLDRAEHNKGGWRDRAIASTDTAIHETERGCGFADTH
jgi:hypothetical protein